MRDQSRIALSRRQTLQLLGAGVGVPSALTSAALWPIAGAAQDAPSGQLTIAQSYAITDLDASMRTGIQTFLIASHIMEPLIFRAADLQLEPMLAESFEYLDPTTLRLPIRQGVTFHDGAPLTVEDVVFTLQRAADPDGDSRHNIYMTAMDTVTALDDQTVEITFASHDVAFLSRLSLIPIVPKAIVEELGDAGFNAEPMGTGPYRFLSWQVGGDVTVEAYLDYWREPATIGTLIFQGITEDTTRVASLSTGEVHLIDDVPTQMVPEIEQGDTARVETVNGLRSSFALLNSHQPPFDDLRMRQAVNYAIDKNLLVEGVLDGYAQPIDQPFGPEVFGYNPEVENYYPYDPEQAMSLMAEAGLADGVEINMFSFVEFGEELALNIAAQLEEVGFTVNLQTLEWQGYFDSYLNIPDPNPELHIGLLNNANNTADADYNLSLNFHSEARGLYWQDQELDALIDQGRETIDPAAREAIYRELTTLLAETAAIVPLLVEMEKYGVSNRLLNWEPRSDELMYVYGSSLSE